MGPLLIRSVHSTLQKPPTLGFKHSSFANRMRAEVSCFHLQFPGIHAGWHIFMGLLLIHISSSGNPSSYYFVHFSGGLFLTDGH